MTRPSCATCATCGQEADWETANRRRWFLVQRASGAAVFACSRACLRAWAMLAEGKGAAA